jgi:hypothetical protein
MTLKGSTLRIYREAWEDSHSDSSTLPPLDELERWYKETHIFEDLTYRDFYILMGIFVACVIVMICAFFFDVYMKKQREDSKTEEEEREGCFITEEKMGVETEKILINHAESDYLRFDRYDRPFLEFPEDKN